MFLLLVVVCTLHQVYATASEKVDRWPLRLIYMRLVEFIGRSLLMPAVLITFARLIYTKDLLLQNL
jgi:hypothetical protein